MLSADLLSILRCPVCVSNKVGLLNIIDDWLVCTECNRRYPIEDGIPILIIHEAVLSNAPQVTCYKE